MSKTKMDVKEKCMQSAGNWNCSLNEGHSGDHLAFECHDVKLGIIGRSRNAAARLSHPGGEVGERCGHVFIDDSSLVCDLPKNHSEIWHSTESGQMRWSGSDRDPDPLGTIQHPEEAAPAEAIQETQIKQSIAYLAKHTEGEIRAFVEVISNRLGYGHAIDVKPESAQTAPFQKSAESEMGSVVVSKVETESPQAEGERVDPCPFCGQDAEETYANDLSYYYVGCCNEDCAVQPETGLESSEEAARKAWNWRTR